MPSPARPSGEPSSRSGPIPSQFAARHPSLYAPTADRTARQGKAPAKLLVAPCFLPNFFAGDYWILDGALSRPPRCAPAGLAPLLLRTAYVVVGSSRRPARHPQPAAGSTDGDAAIANQGSRVYCEPAVNQAGRVVVTVGHSSRRSTFISARSEQHPLCALRPSLRSRHACS